MVLGSRVSARVSGLHQLHERPQRDHAFVVGFLSRENEAQRYER